jgi:hypothetical protein
MVFKSIRGLLSTIAAACNVGIWRRLADQDHPAYIPRPGLSDRVPRMALFASVLMIQLRH